MVPLSSNELVIGTILQSFCVSMQLIKGSASTSCQHSDKPLKVIGLLEPQWIEPLGKERENLE